MCVFGSFQYLYVIQTRPKLTAHRRETEQQSKHIHTTVFAVQCVQPCHSSGRIMRTYCSTCHSYRTLYTHSLYEYVIATAEYCTVACLRSRCRSLDKPVILVQNSLGSVCYVSQHASFKLGGQNGGPTCRFETMPLLCTP